MKNLLTSCFVALSLSFFAGCDDKTSAAGLYQLDTAPFREQMAEAMKDLPPDVRSQQIDQALATMSGSVELAADGTAVMKMMMMEDTKGTWQLDGSTITLTTKDKDGKEESKTGKYADGTITLEEMQDGKKMSMVFRRK